MIVTASRNRWSLTLIGHEDGRVQVCPVNCPVEVFELIMRALAAEKKPELMPS